MGDGYTYHCAHCGKSYDVFLGSGMRYPITCGEVLDAVKAGEYGQKLKEAAADERPVGVAAEHRLYKCDECGNWEILPDASIYGWADKNKDAAIDFVILWGDGYKDYRLIEEYVPACEKCGGVMHSKKITEKLRLTCPECGEPLSLDLDFIRWD